MDRRAFLSTIAALGAGGLALPASPAAAHAVPPATPPLPPTASTALATPRLLSLLGDDSLVSRIGHRYRAMVTSEDDAGRLTRALVPDSRCSVDEPAAWIDGQVRQDFTAGRTVTVEGWILSLTEARQCALYSLLRG